MTPGFVRVTGEVYKRPAVRYEGDRYETRPEPQDAHDRPCERNRGRYYRQDGTGYQFDAGGRVFELTNGVVYETTEQVRACYEEISA